MSIGSSITTNFNETNLSKEFIKQFQHLTNQTTSIQSRSSKLLKTNSISIPRYDQSELQLSNHIQFRPALLTSNIHRFTISVLPIYSTISFELDRLRSWQDPIRTAIWATIYTIFWFYRLTFFGFLSIVLCFSLSPNQTYSILFPTTTPVTPSTTSSNTPTTTLLDTKDGLQESLPFDIPIEDTMTENDGIKLQNLEESQNGELIILPDILITDSNITPIKPNDDEVHSISSSDSNPTPSSIKSSDLSMDQSFTSAKSVITSSTSIKSDFTSPDSIKFKTASSPSIKSKTPSSKSKKSNKPSSTTSQSSFLPTKYRTHVEKYGGGVQNIAAGLSDGHERFMNLFKGKYVKPTRTASTKSTEPEELWISPNIRLSLIVSLLLMVSYFIPTEIILRSISLIIGVVLFVIEPLQKRYKWISSILDPEQGILKDVPTDRAWVLFELRQIKSREGLKGLYRVLSVLNEECHVVKGQEMKPEELINSNEISTSLETHNFKSTSTPLSNPSTSTSSTKSSKRIKLVNTSRKLTKFLVNSNDLLKFDNYVNPIIQPANSSIYLNIKTKLKKQTNTIESNLSNLILKEVKETKEVQESKVKEAGESETEEEEMIRFGCCFKRLPGELKVYEQFIRFDSGFNFLNKSLNKSNSTTHLPSSIDTNHSDPNSNQIQINFNQIVSIKKSSGIGITGIWGSIDGIEIETEKPLIEANQNVTEDSGEGVCKEVYKFWNLNQRDLCFIFLMVLRDWKEDESVELNQSGWISI
ncbi:hypothetical protein DFH28DRAFT_1085765 [Melampsora americana]|nr:hypothetical protein DFH28DRAFT_1085765 [Melampsora americana]